jgi:class 3 adenylate cyclase
MISHGAVLCVLLLAGAAAALLGVARPLDHALLDAQFALLRAHLPRPAARDVVVVGIDEDTVRALPEPLTLWHRHLGRLLSALAGARPAAVGIDLVLPERSFDAVAPGYDAALLRGLLEARRAYPLVLARTVDRSGAPRGIHAPFLRAAGEDAVGYALLGLDADGVARRFDERLGAGGEAVPTLAGQMARRLGAEAGHGLIDFAQGPRFDYLPLHVVLAWIERGDSVSLARAFRGKPVLLGVVLPYEDRQRLPVSLAAWEPASDTNSGVLLHAQALRSLLNRGLIADAAPAAAAALAAAGALLWLVPAAPWLAALALAAFFAALLALSTALLALGTYLPVAAAACTGLVALAGRGGWEAALRLRERRRLRGAFGGYVSPAVMRDILDGRIQPELGGVSRYVCILFSDIRGYTTRSETMAPEQVIGFLNRYFEQTVAVIHRHGGSVVSFMGDGIMAMFGAPNELDNPCAAAFEAGRGMLEYVAEFNARHRLEGEQPVEIGIGLHAGEAVVGHVGSATRHDYTAIGDVTNVASRVEGLTKEAGYRLLCTRAVAERLPERAALAPLGAMAIKGHSPVEVYGYAKA